MPAGDAGLEPGPETACRAYPVEAEEALTAWMDSKARDGIWVSPAGWWYAAWMHRQPEIDRLRAQLAAQQAVVDAARWSITGTRRAEHEQCGKSCIWRRLIDALAALDKAQAVQPEGKRR